MLIDATHKEELRVAITDGNKIIEYDYESQNRRPIKGSIFLAKVTRVEPSLQAAFVNFGGNRHGFLPFSEIHPDYFKIPVADRDALIAEQESLIKEHDDEEALIEQEDADDNKEGSDLNDEINADADNIEDNKEEPADIIDGNKALPELNDSDKEDTEQKSSNEDQNSQSNDNKKIKNKRGYRGRGNKRSQYRNRNVEVVGGEEIENNQRFRFNLRRKYKIQEVIKRGQIVLVQANKEERGNKGAAVGTYLSLPGRYCVLMPNSPRGGGVSRKIANSQDRARMRDIIKELEIPKGMSVIVRTAGVSRSKVEIKRDLDYLIRLWNNIRELTLQSSAPAIVYEEADLIKRSVRDLYTRDIEEIHIAGEEGYKTAKDFMKMMIPSHVKKIKKYEETKIPLFNRYQIENQINEIGQPEVRLKSGGYLVINPTEALISIDVNSGKATKGRHIEETALRTNMEAAEEVARQLKLRDLGGLVVIDFIDMEERRNNGKVERKMKDALSTDRARVQVGRISSFGLMELSRQRLSSSLIETQFEQCKKCNGIGLIRTEDAMSIMVLRAIEEEGIRARAEQIIVKVNIDVVLYILNHKRNRLAQIEETYNIQVLLRVDDSIASSEYLIEVSKPTKDSESNNSKLPTIKSEENKQDSSDKNLDNDKPKRRSRRGGRNNNKQLNENKTDNNEQESVKETPVKKSSNKTENPANDDKSTNKKEVTKAKEPNAAAKKEETPDKPSVASEHETINQAPKNKKKGWWNRLVE